MAPAGSTRRTRGPGVEFCSSASPALGDRRRRADRAPEGAARALPLRWRRRAGVDPRRAAAPPGESTSPTWRRREVIDLSVPTPGPAEPLQPTIEYEDHAKTAPLIAQIFGCEVSNSLTARAGLGDGHADTTRARTSTRRGTSSPTSGAARAHDRRAAARLVPAARRAARRAQVVGERIEVAHLAAALGAYELQPYDIVLLWTGADSAWTPRTTSTRLRPHARVDDVAADAVKVIGPTPGASTARSWRCARRRADQGRLDPVEAHRAGIDREYCQIEKLHNLGALPARPLHRLLPAVKVAGASAGSPRAA